jgi:hypothetical protein
MQLPHPAARWQAGGAAASSLFLTLNICTLLVHTLNSNNMNKVTFLYFHSSMLQLQYVLGCTEKAKSNGNINPPSVLRGHELIRLNWSQLEFFLMCKERYINIHISCNIKQPTAGTVHVEYTTNK